MRLSLLLALCVLTVASLSSGCAALGLGAGTSMAGASTVNNGALKSTVKGSLDDVYGRTQGVFQELGIQHTNTRTVASASGLQRKLDGRFGEHLVLVTLDQTAHDTTEVEVKSGENATPEDRQVAREIITRLASR